MSRASATKGEPPPPWQTLMGEALTLDENKDGKNAIKLYARAAESALAELRREPGRSRAAATAALRVVRQALTRAEFLRARESFASLNSKDVNVELSNAWQEESETVVGMPAAKAALAEALVLPRLQPGLFLGERRPWRGILLYGPPGTGKTALASKLSKAADCEFVSVSAADVMSLGLGESEARLRGAFDDARRRSRRTNRPCVLFLDEVDALGGSRREENGNDEARRRVLAELLLQMDGARSAGERVVVVGATNLPHQLDSALRRRFERRVLVGLPDAASRALIFARHLGPPGKEHNVSAREIASLAASEAMPDMSGADVAALANDTLMGPVREALSSTHFAPSPVDPEKLSPCSSDAPGAIRISLLDENFDPDRLLVRPAGAADALKAARERRATVSRVQLDRLTRFAREYGDPLDGTLEDSKSVNLEELASRVRNEAWSGRDATPGLLDSMRALGASILTSLGRLVSGKEATESERTPPREQRVAMLN